MRVDLLFSAELTVTRGSTAPAPLIDPAAMRVFVTCHNDVLLVTTWNTQPPAMVHVRKIVRHCNHLECHSTSKKEEDRRSEEEMKTKLLYTGAISMGIAAALALLDLTMIRISFSDTSLSTMTIYPAAFFAFLGLLLIYNGLRPLWQK